MDLSRIRCLVKIASMSSCALPKKTCKLQMICNYRSRQGEGGEDGNGRQEKDVTGGASKQRM